MALFNRLQPPSLPPGGVYLLLGTFCHCALKVSVLLVLCKDRASVRDPRAGARGQREQLATIPMVWRICCEWATWWLPAGLVAAMTAAAGGIASRRDDGAATGRGHLRQFRLRKALIRCARAVHEAGRGAEFGFRLDGLCPGRSSVQSWNGSVGCVP